MERWFGKVAMVTGASAGLGAAIAEELVKHGLKVVGLARRVDRIKVLSEKLKAESGQLYSVKCDMSVEEEILEAFEWVKQQLGTVHILVNNAGISIGTTQIYGKTQDWRLMLNVNVLAVSICSREAIKMMKETGIEQGHIINMNSLTGRFIPPTLPGIGTYGCTKHALTALTEGLRGEIVAGNHNIKITSISPGLVKTEILSDGGRREPDTELYNTHPYLTTKDVADAIVFILATPPNVVVNELTMRPMGQQI